MSVSDALRKDFESEFVLTKKYLEMAEDFAIHQDQKEVAMKIVIAVFSLAVEAKVHERLLTTLAEQEFGNLKKDAIFRDSSAFSLSLQAMFHVCGGDRFVQKWFNKKIATAILKSLCKSMRNLPLGWIFALMEPYKPLSVDARDLTNVTGAVLLLRCALPAFPENADLDIKILSAAYQEMFTGSTTASTKAWRRALRHMVRRTQADPKSQESIQVQPEIEILSQYRLDQVPSELREWKPSRSLIRANFTRHWGLVNKVKRHMLQVYGFEMRPLEPFTLLPEFYATLWSAQFEIVAMAKVTPLWKEIVQASVSFLNSCDLCLDLHSTAALKYGLAYTTVHPLVRGKITKPQSDVTAELIDVVQWALVSNQPKNELVLRPRIKADYATELYGAAFLKHFFNRTTNTFLREFTRARGTVMKAVTLMQKSSAAKKVIEKEAKKIAPGQGLSFARKAFSYLNRAYPETDTTSESSAADSESSTSNAAAAALLAGRPISPEFHWAVPNPLIAEALQAWEELEIGLASESLPPVVLAKLHASLDGWDCSSRFSEEEMTKFVSDLGPSEAIMTRLLVSIAQNPTRVSPHLCNQFRDLFPPEIATQCIVAGCSYSAFLAAKTISSHWVLPK